MNLPSATSADDCSPIVHLDWRPDELGLVRAFLLAGVAVGLLAAGLAALADRFVATPPPLPVTVRLVEPTAAPSPSTQAEAALPDAATTAPLPPIAQSAPPVPDPIAPTVPEPITSTVAEPIAPSVTPAPDLTPDSIPDTIPGLASEVTLPITAPRQTALLPSQPAARPVLRRPARPPPSPAATGTMATEEAPRSSAAERATAFATPRPTPADITSGLGPYRAALHRQIERNMLNEHEVQRLGVSGTALIEASLAPDGRVLLARIARSSGNHAIDQAALAAVQRGGFAAFGAHMPAEPITISVPIGVEAE